MLHSRALLYYFFPHRNYAFRGINTKSSDVIEKALIKGNTLAFNNFLFFIPQCRPQNLDRSA